MKKTIKYLFYILSFGAIATLPAYAYLDPATTSYLIPTIIAVFVACGTTIGIFWKKIALFFKKKQMKHLEKKYAKIGSMHAKAQADSATANTDEKGTDKTTDPEQGND